MISSTYDVAITMYEVKFWTLLCQKCVTIMFGLLKTADIIKVVISATVLYLNCLNLEQHPINTF